MRVGGFAPGSGSVGNSCPLSGSCAGSGMVGKCCPPSGSFFEGSGIVGKSPPAPELKVAGTDCEDPGVALDSAVVSKSFGIAIPFVSLNV